MTLRRAALALALLSSACATAPAPSPVAPVRAAPTEARAAAAPAPAAAPIEELPACPDDIRREQDLEQGASGRLTAGEFLDAARRAELTPAPLFTRALQLARGQAEAVAWMQGGSTSLAVLRTHAGGACVVNVWGTYLGAGQVHLAGAWTAKTGSHAVLLLRLQGDALSETRWVVLATDGRGVWPAFGSAGAMQARVPKMALQERQGQLQLAVTMTRTSLYAFDPKRGVFVTQ